MKHRDYIVNHWNEVLTFLKSRLPLFHLSNLFFRDVQFGIHAFLSQKGIKVTYRAAEPLAVAFMEKLEQEKIVAKLDRQTWVVRHAEFKTPVTKAPPAAKPATPAAGPTPSPRPPA